MAGQDRRNGAAHRLDPKAITVTLERLSAHNAEWWVRRPSANRRKLKIQKKIQHGDTEITSLLAKWRANLDGFLARERAQATFESEPSHLRHPRYLRASVLNLSHGAFE